MNKSSEVYRRRINRVIDYVNNHLEKTFSLEELAEVACFSPYHFHRVFVAVTGESVNFFTNRIRLEKAARLLRYAGQPVAEIAHQCGFSSPSAFSRAFKQYFETSPSAFRKSGEIENSKIRQELFPLDQYLVPMSQAELIANFPVEIRDYPQRRIAYIRVMDSYSEGVVPAAFEKMMGWAKKVGVFHSGKIFGMSIDDPMVTPKENYRYEVGITLPDAFRVDPEDYMDTTVIPKCKCAVISVSGDHSYAATAIHYLFNHWLVNSSYEPAHQHGMEFFHDNTKASDWSHFDLDLCMPIKTIGSY